MNMKHLMLIALTLLGASGVSCLVFELPYSATHTQVVDFDLDGDSDIVLGCPVTGVDTLLVSIMTGTATSPGWIIRSLI